MANPNLFLGRQPIVDRNEQIVAYELLFRSSAESVCADFNDQNQAAASVVVDTFMHMGPNKVLGPALGFFNVTRAVLESGAMAVLPADRVVIEILEDIVPDDSALAACEALRKEGFSLALDDYVPGDPREEMLPLVDWVKVDLLETDPKKLKRLVRQLRSTDVKLLAEKVSTRAEFERCHAMGFEYFQGFYFAYPEILTGRSLEPGQAALLELMGRLQRNEDTKCVVEGLEPHPSLSVGLLRIANSPAMARTQRLARVEDALVYLGRRQLQRWLAVLLFAENSPGGFRDPLLVTAAKRGRLLELAARHMDVDAAWCERAFLVGILASIDVLLGHPKQEIIQELRLDSESEAALLTHSGRLGELLFTAEAFERGEFARVEEALADLGIPAEEFQADEVAAYAWVHGLAEELP
ncbi:MAG: EAL domain-containing protein [Deltaproteobacteria bacterium]|nr:EAL domain-containing protein [Deltaproteobacteria bacterium]